MRLGGNPVGLGCARPNGKNSYACGPIKTYCTVIWAWQMDITLGNMILVAITSRPERKIYAERCDGSGVKLLQKRSCTL